MLLDQARAVLGAHAVVTGQAPVLCLQAAVLAMDVRHLVSHTVQVTLELVLHFSGQAGAVGVDLLQVFPLFRAGELEGKVCGEEGFNLHEESLGDVGDATQGLEEVIFAFFFVEQQLFFLYGFFPPQTDGLQVNVVPLFGSLVHFYPHPLCRLGEVGLH